MGRVSGVPVGPPAAEVQQHGEHPLGVRRVGRQVKLREDVGHVLFDRAQVDVALLRDALVGPAFCHQGQDFALARGEAGQAVAGRRFMINSDTICGSIADPPSATRRTDSTKSRTLRILSFNR